nr:hypothetical protein BDOA9_0131660 [Bradyrhizobium sp. DOA9]
MRLILHLLGGLICALSVIAISVVSRGTVEPVFTAVWTPATWLVRLSNVLCPPMGVRCVLGSVSQGAHHLWFGLCLLGFWWIVMSFAIWPLVRRRRPSSEP